MAKLKETDVENKTETIVEIKDESPTPIVTELTIVKTEDKTLNVINNNDLILKVSDVEIYGEDIWHLLCKASSKSENWMKSTKVMNVHGGCLVQVTTQNKDSIAESVVFVPHNMFKDGKIVGM